MNENEHQRKKEKEWDPLECQAHKVQPLTALALGSSEPQSDYVDFNPAGTFSRCKLGSFI